MSRHNQKPKRIDMVCPACKRGDCHDCINISLIFAGRNEICQCIKKDHNAGEPNRKQILDPVTGTVHAPGLTVDMEGEVVRTDNPSPAHTTLGGD